MTQVFLHIGMHKTGSTAIQKRLEANGLLLQQHRISFDIDSENLLKPAVKKRDFGPWQRKLDRARANNNALLVSAEVLSHLLARQQTDSDGCLGDWLVQAFQKQGCSVTLIAFLRDQPSYLNSQYTQHVKKFGLACDFDSYARLIMGHSQERGECDPQRLFGWIRRNRTLSAHFIPYGGSRALDPFEQVLAVIGAGPAQNWRNLPRINEQPGRLAIETALAAQRRLANKGKTIKDPLHRKRASRLLQLTANLYGWPKQRFSGLTPELYREIRAHYRASNDAFAQEVWGAADWSTVFPEEPPLPQPELRRHQRWLVAWESRRISWMLMLIWMVVLMLKRMR